ncbi:MAG: RNA polymerase [Devosia sp.]|uniref:NepR family anti-sigma factor n=1 Tax=Devosia sp. TaxID=1871048 RepID=UPI0024CCB2D4|nr:NepR family anti-sigma factor [Devosia sp.]UYO01142.1 MAG: RNA polymerase [Devosia sp.]
MVKDSNLTQSRHGAKAGRVEEGLGPNSDIGSRLRALYGAVQDEGVPGQLLDLLERLDSAEEAQSPGKRIADGK